MNDAVRPTLTAALLVALLALPSAPAQAQTVRLLQAGTEVDRISARLGQIISIDVVVDLGTVSATGFALSISFPDGPFRVIDVSAAAGTQPFDMGPLFEGAVVVSNSAVPPQDVPDVFAGSRLLDLSATARSGGERGRTGAGVLATFQLHCIAESEDIRLAVDVNPVRQSFVISESGSEVPLRIGGELRVKIAGLELLDIPDVILLPGVNDSTRIGLLSRYLVNNHAPADSILWSITGAEPGSLNVQIVGKPRRVRITPNPAFRGRRTLTFTATEPKAVVSGAAPPSDSETAIVIVNTPPRFTVRRDTVVLDEDVNNYVVSARNEPDPARALRGRDLDLIVEDPEVPEARRHTAFTYGTATFRAGTDTLRQVRGRVDPVTHELLTWSRPAFSGVDSFRVIVGDEFTLNRVGQDTLRVIVIVNEIPDPPRFLIEDVLSMQVNSRTSLALADMVVDDDTPLSDLTLSWTPDFGGKFTAVLDGDSLSIQAPALPAQGLFIFTVTDPEGLSDRIPLRVRATPLPPDSTITPGLPDFTISPPLPDAMIEVGAVLDVLALDDHVVPSGGLLRDQIIWSLRTIDDDLHALAAIRPGRLLRLWGIAAGQDSLVLRGRGPQGRVLEDTMIVQVTDSRPETRRVSLSPMPDVDFVAGHTFTAFDLDDFVVDRTAHPDSLVSWQARFLGPASMIIQVRSDHTVFTSSADSAVATVIFEAEDLLLRVTGRDTVRFTARPASFGRLPLALPDLTLAPGTVDSLALDTFLPASVTATDTAWTVSGQRLSTPLLRGSAPHTLRVTAPPSRVGTDTLSLRVNLGRGFGALGSMRVHIVEAVTPDDYRVVLIPNAVAPDYVAVYIVARRAVAAEPVVTRTLAGLPATSVPVRSIVTDLARRNVLVWSGTTRLPRPLSGKATVRATATTERGTPLSATSAIAYGSARAGQPVDLSAQAWQAHFPADAVPEGTFLVLAPDMPAADGLTSEILAVDANPLWQLGPEHLAFVDGVTLYPAGLALTQPASLLQSAGSPSGSGVYRRNAQQAWHFLAAGARAEMHALGTYAVLLDTLPPQIDPPTQISPGRFAVGVYDGGSGLDRTAASVRVADVEVETRWQGEGVLSWSMPTPTVDARPGFDTRTEAVLQLADRVGNVVTQQIMLQPPALPRTFELGSPYPNPFNPSTHIPFALPHASSLRIDVYDVVGQRVRQLAQGPWPAGHHAVQWDGRDDGDQHVASGVYLVRLTSRDRSVVTRVMLLR